MDSFFSLDSYILVNRIALFTVVSFSMFLGGLVYIKDKRNKINQLFFLMSIFFSLWPAFGYLTFFTSDPDTAHFWVRWAYASVSCFTVILYFFFDEFFERKLPKYFKYFIVLSGATFGILSFFTNLIVQSIQLQPLGVKPIFAVGAYFFYLFVFIVFSITFYQFYKNYQVANSEDRRKIKFFFIGTSVFLVLNTIFNIIIPIWTGSFTLHQFGNYAAIFLLGFTAYAIVQSGLFNIQVVATEATSVILWVVLFSKIFTEQDSTQTVVDIIVFLVVFVFGFLLIRSVRRELEQRKQLEDLNQRLEDIDKKKDEFLNVASHELRAPMTAIKGYISMTQNGDGGEIPPEARDLLHEAEEENNRMIRLVNNMLNVARIEEGRMVFEPGTVNLAQIVSRVYNEFKFDAQEKHLEYIYTPPGPIHDLVEVDIDRIHEVITNLINNAIKYTDSGKVVVRVFNPEPSIVRFEVEDTGPGLSADEQEKLFQKFYRAESNIGKKIGTGLGLYISKLLVEKFGGRIGLKSEKGKGSVFWFELPAQA